MQYSSVIEAAQAAKQLRLLTFNGKQVQVDYHPLSLFSRGVGGMMQEVRNRIMVRLAS